MSAAAAPTDPAARLRAIADELYALPAAGFIAERTARVREIRDGGDRPLADAVGRLARPTAAAALVNAVVREAGVEALVALGDRLRAAQDEGDAALLRTLAADRRHLVAELVQRAAALGGDRAPGQSVLDEVERTLTAAVLDGAAASAVRSGRLVRGVSADGIEPADVAGAVAVDADSPAAATPSAPAAPMRVSAERRRAEELARQADQQAEAARQELAQAETAVAEAEQTSANRLAAADDLRRQVADLRRRLGAAEAAADAAEDDLDAARTTLRAARREADRATDAAEQARAV
ncbi:transposase [uncultured Amnibacterium sp.]|uniref:transposase n=1 Tax=uncultured Amnibacterium sp. TaxID=1631851 RepID=UPI0035CAD779